MDYLTPIEITDDSDLLRVAQEVHASNEPRLLRYQGEDLAVVSPLPKPRVAGGRPTEADDPLWSMVGIGASSGPTDVSENKYKYLEDAYSSKAS